jgi:hypothetical protein
MTLHSPPGEILLLGIAFFVIVIVDFAYSIIINIKNQKRSNN